VLRARGVRQYATDHSLLRSQRSRDLESKKRVAINIVDNDGTVLDATFSVLYGDDQLSVVYESSGGRAGGPNPRNLQYRRGLNVLLRRLQQLDAVIDEIRVESERTRLLPVDQQRVRIENRSFPLPLAGLGDVEDLRREISRYGRKVGQSPEKAIQSGGSSRRLRIFISGVSLDAQTLERQVAGSGIDAESPAVEAVVEIAAGRARGDGQGFLVSQAVRKAVESYAVAWAMRHYTSQGWTVDDVGLTESYDLDCTRSPDRLHVEVKGTTTRGEKIILTSNEVAHARTWHPNVELFLVSDIEVYESDTDHPVPSGGTARVWSRWMPKTCLLYTF
jgi:hypothetical protein